MNNNQILFATDFSSIDWRAFCQSCQLAADWNANLHILFVQDPREPAKSRSLQTDHEKEFLKFRPVDSSIQFNQVLRIGEPAEEILKYADLEDISLIVLGTHGRKGLKRLVSGSVAEKVIRKAECAVMTVRNTAGSDAEHQLAQILVPIDFSEFGYAAADFASRLAVESDAVLTFCHVDETDVTASSAHPHGNPDWTAYQESLWSQLCKFQPTSSKIECTHKLLKGNAAKEICDYAESKHHDYIVLGTHGRSGLFRAVMGSVSEQIVRNAKCPVITVKPGNATSNKETGSGTERINQR